MKEIGIEEVKNFWNARPCNIRHSPAPIGTEQYFSEITKRKYFVEPHILEFAEFPRWKDKSVIEIGCGIGTDAESFAKEGSRYTGIELSSESIAIAKKRFDILNLEGDFKLGNAEELEKLDLEKYDLIYSFGVLHHTPNIAAALKQIYSLAHAGSEIKIMIYAKNSWKQKMIDGGLDQPEAQFGCPIANSYTQDEALKLMNDNGFRVTSIRQAHIFPYQIEEYKAYNYVKEPWFEAMTPQIFSILEKEFGWHLLIDAKI